MESGTPELSVETPPSRSKRIRKRKKKSSAKKKQTQASIREEEEETSTPQNLAQDLEAAASQTSQPSSPSQLIQTSFNPNLPAGTSGNTTTLPPTMFTGNTVKIGGMNIQVNASANTQPATVGIRNKKEDRSKLDEEKRDTLFYNITKQQHTVFEEQPLTINSIKDLEDTYSLQNALTTVEIHLTRKDAIDVFTIVFPKKDPTTGAMLADLETDANGDTKMVDLFSRYSTIKPADVAASCNWYATWPDETVSPWFKENLELTYEYFQNHMSTGLWGRIQQDMAPYANTAAGKSGPMLFIFMLHRLQSNSLLVVDTIKKHMPTLRIDQYGGGENVDELVSHFRSLLLRLRSLDKEVDGKVVHSHVPDDLSKTLIGILQTSSDSRFNDLFKNKEQEAFAKHCIGGEYNGYGTPEDLLILASRAYQAALVSPEGWKGIFHKVNATGFSADGTGDVKKCWNCGNPGCSMQKCTAPRNEERIKKMKKAFYEKKKGATKGGGKAKKKGTKKGQGKSFPNLAKPEQREKNRAKVSDLWYWWHFKDQIWYKCKNQSDPANQPYAMHVATPAPAPAPAATPPAGGTSDQSISGLSAVTGPTVAVPGAFQSQVATVAHHMNSLIELTNVSQS